MIVTWSGSLFDTPAQVLVNPVDTVGVMGKGLALEFKRPFPEMEQPYRNACRTGELRPGTLFFWRATPHSIINFPTKIHWRDSSTLALIERGLSKFADTYEQFGATSIAFPQLGCGNGGLKWNEVGPLMCDYLADLPIEIGIVESP